MADFELPDLVAKLRIDVSQLDTVSARVAASMASVQRAANDAVGGLPDNLGRIGQDSGHSLGEGIARGTEERVAASAGRLAKAGERGGEETGKGFLTGLRSRLSRVDETLSTVGRTLSSFGRGLQFPALIIGLAALSQQALALAAALAPTVGILAAIPAAAGAAGASLSTLAVGLSGIVAAFKAIGKTTAGGGGGGGGDLTGLQRAVEAAARGIAAAERGVRDALRGVDEANRDVVKSYKDLDAAQRGVAAAAVDVDDAQKAVVKAQKDFARSIEDVTRAQREAARAQQNVVAAQEDVVRAQSGVDKALRAVVVANRNVAVSTRDLSAAQNAAIAAQDALNDAREQARRILASYDDQLKGASADEEEADIARLRAQKELNNLIKRHSHDQLALREARVNVTEAELRYKAAVQATADLQAKATKAQAAGVEGDAGVVAAKQQVADATQSVDDANQRLLDSQQAVIDANDNVTESQHRVRDAIAGVADAQQSALDALENITNAQDRVAESADKVVAAQRGVAEANQGVLDAQDRVAEAAQGVIDAQQGVADANEKVALAQEELTLSHQRLADAQAALAKGFAGGASAVAKAEEALNKLAPAARATVLAVVSLRDEWTNLTHAVQQRLFEGLDKEVLKLAQVSFPTLQTGMVSVAGSFNDTAKAVSGLVQTPLFQGAMATVFETTSKSIDVLNKAVEPLGLGLARLTEVGQPLVLRFAEWVSGGLQTAGAFLASEEGARKMRDVMDEAADRLHSVFDIAVNLTKVLVNLFKVADSGDFLKNLENITARMAEFTGSADGQKRMGEIFAAVGEVAKHMAESLRLMSKAVADLLVFVDRLPGPVKNIVLDFLGWSLVLAPLLRSLGALSTGLGGFIKIAVGLGRTVAAIGGFVAALSPVTLAVVAVVAVIALLAYETYKHWDGIKKATKEAWDYVAARISDAVDYVTNLFLNFTVPGQIIQHWGTITKATHEAFDDVKATIGRTVDFIVGLFENFTLPGLIFKHWDSITKATSFAWSAVSDTVGGAWDSVRGTTSRVAGEVRDAVSGAWDAVSRRTSDAWDGFTGTISNAWRVARSIVESGVDSVTGAVRGLPNTIANALGDLYGKFKALAGDIIRGLVDGLVDAPGVKRIVDKAGDLARKALDAARQVVGAHSPARKFRELGRNMGEGLVLGMADMETATQAAAKALVRIPTTNFATHNIRAATGGANSAAAVGAGTVINNNLTFNAADVPAAQVAREAVNQVRLVELRQRYK